MIKKQLFVLIALTLVIGFAAPVYAKGSPNGKGKPGGGGGAQLKSVCIDAGHGGSDSGTVSPDGSIRESDLNLDVARALQNLLEQNAFTTHMTRDDYASTLNNNDRYTYCNSTDASTLISIHHNGSTNQQADYSLGLYQQRNSRELARIVGSSVAESFGMADTFRIEKFPSGVLIKSDMPSMMSEGYFLTNSERAASLKSDYEGVVQQEASALFDGIQAYYAR